MNRDEFLSAATNAATVIAAFATLNGRENPTNGRLIDAAREVLMIQFREVLEFACRKQDDGISISSCSSSTK